MSATINRPRPVIEYNARDPAYSRNWVETAHQRLEKYPVAWTEAYGGHWVISKYDDVRQAALDPVTFSSANRNPEKPWLQGIIIPPSSHRLSLSESDPPVHGPLRMTEAPFFTPRSVAGWEPMVVDRVNEVIDAFIEAGKCDMVNDLGIPVPAMTTMELAGVDLAYWKEFALSAHEMSFRTQDDPLYPHAEVKFVQGKLVELIHARRANPRHDVISAIATRVIDGVPLSDEAGLGMLNAFIFGGFDTATSLIVSSLLWLEGKQDLYPRLLADDALLRNAVEEFLRMYPPNHNLARTATRDVEIRGQLIKEGERVMLSWAAANRDPEKFPNPDEVQIDRANASDHLSFSWGIHKCLGSPLARVEVKHVLKAVMSRLPDYKFDRGGLEVYPSFGGVGGYIAAPASFSAGARLKPVV